MTDSLFSAPTPLDANRLPLWGSHLIEASAGTGKTWTIAALYVRLVLSGVGAGPGPSRPLTPPDILVMTFTRAATRELSDRIRARLVQAADCLRNPSGASLADPFLRHLCDHLPAGMSRSQAAWCLSVAAETMDGASIHTIDAWCQRVLREQAFESGVLWEETLLPDERALQTEAVQDEWRQMCYPLGADALAQVQQVWPDWPTFEQDMYRLLPLDPPPPDGDLFQLLSSAHGERQRALAALKTQWQFWVEGMCAFHQTQLPAADHGWNGKRFPNTHSTKWLNTLRAWAQDPNDGVEPNLGAGWDRMAPSGLLESRKDGVLPELPEGFGQLGALRAALAALPSPVAQARWWVAGRVAMRLQVLKQRRGEVGFADMQRRLLRALEGPRGEALRERILARYPAAMVDEFQDTSPEQYAILDQVYQVQAHHPEHLLLLIGDPKQSIYGFRGADIHSYLRAKHHTAGRHHVLGTNRRSTVAVVAAVNRLFAGAEAQAPQGAFGFGPPGQTPLPYLPVAAQGRVDQWVGSSGPQPALQWAHDPTLRSQGEVRRVYAQHCAEQVVAWLNDPANGFEVVGGGFVRLRPRDVAVLVRSSHEADGVRTALRERGVQSVFLSDRDSVLASDEARDLVYWLGAVSNPQDPVAVRAAMALSTIGWPLSELGQLLGSDDQYDDMVVCLTGLHQVWREQGVLAMLRQTLHRLGLAAHWVQTPGGERRLTNVLHLAELLQAASADLDGEQALVRWLQIRVDDPTVGGDEPLVRLESDADLVQVVTVHKSKGLEYPIVCVPFATCYRPPDKQKGWWAARLPGADGGAVPVLQHGPEVEVQAVQDRLREDVRLLYVALTRARHGLWVGFAALRNGTGQTCETHLGAAGFLVGGGRAQDASAWRALLEEQADGLGGVGVEDLTEDIPSTALHRPLVTESLRDPSVYTGVFDRRWGIASYSRLTRDLQAAAPVLAPWASIRDDDDAPLQPQKTHTDTHLSGNALMHTFQRGPVAGQFLHDQLEWLAAEGFGLNRDPAITARLLTRCEQSRYVADAPALVEWLGLVLASPLRGLGVALQDVTRPQAELEFWVPWEGVSATELDAVCHAHCALEAPRPVLKASELHGMLMGFADLVIEHQGRYWVLDYKSNHLGGTDADYHWGALDSAMAQHRYDVQATVYLLALHRLLRSRLGATYDPAQHLGGALYLFVRGVRGPVGGVYLLPATPAWVGDLDRLLPNTREVI